MSGLFVPTGDGGLRKVGANTTTAAPPAVVGPWECTQLSHRAPADSRELVPLDVRAGGRLVTTGLQVSLTTSPEDRDWRGTLEVHGGRTFLRPGPRPRGWYHVRVRHTSGTVLDAGFVSLR